MDTEERLMSLLAITEDQQSAVAMTIEASKQREEKQHQSFAALMALIAEKHEALNDRYEANLYQQSNVLADRASWINMGLFAGVTFLVCLIAVLAAYLYLGHVVDKTNVAETRYEELKRHNVEILSCVYEGKEYPCLPVKRSWGSYEGGTVFIIDAE